MAVYRLYREQILGSDLKSVWAFISDPKNLARITPDYLGFEITTENLPDHIYPGLITCYKVRPLLGLKIKWVTEITHVRNLEYFVDEQRVGPYTIWHHEHHLKKVANGVLMKDIVTYCPPLGIFGALMNAVVIRSKLNDIFDYRESALQKQFPD